MKVIQMQANDPKIININPVTDNEEDYRKMAKMIASVMVKKVINSIKSEDAERRSN